MTEDPIIQPDSTWLHPGTSSLEQLKDWVLTMMGYPLVTCELTDGQLNVAIQNALEKYTKYATFDTQDIIVSLENYDNEKGLDLTEYNVADIHDIAFKRDALLYGYGTDMFFGMPAMLQSYAGAGVFPFFNNAGSTAGSWIGLHNLHENLEMIHRLTGSAPTYRYDRLTHHLKIIPAPKTRKPDAVILISAEIEPTPEQLYGNEYVKRLTLAYAKIILGTVRKKIQNVQLPGGGTIDTSIGDEGREELNQIMETIRQDESFGNIALVM